MSKTSQPATGKIIATASSLRGLGKTSLALALTARLGNAQLIDWDANEGPRSACNMLERATARHMPYPFAVSNGSTKLLDVISERDYAVVDIEGPTPQHKLEQLKDAHLVLVPTKTDSVSFESVYDIVNSLADGTNYRIVFTQVSDIDELSTRQNELTRWRVPYLRTHIPSNPAIATLAERGLLVDQEPHNEAARAAVRAYDALTNEVRGLL